MCQPRNHRCKVICLYHQYSDKTEQTVSRNLRETALEVKTSPYFLNKTGFLFHLFCHITNALYIRELLKQIVH